MFLQQRRSLSVLAVGVALGLVGGGVLDGDAADARKKRTFRYSCLKNGPFVNTAVRIHNRESKAATVTISHEGAPTETHTETIAPRGVFDENGVDATNVIDVTSNRRLLLDGTASFTVQPHGDTVVFQIRCT